jgi:4-hydroxybenzoate decarboxylase
MVDETVNPFDLKQVMWALSTKVNPAGDLVVLPHMSILPLDPGSMPEGMTHKLIIDATTPVPPECYHATADALDECSRLLCTLQIQRYWGDYGL